MLLFAASAEPEYGWGRLIGLAVAVVLFVCWIYGKTWWDKIKNPAPPPVLVDDGDEFSLVDDEDQDQTSEGAADGRSIRGYSVRYTPDGRRELIPRYDE